MPTYEYECKTCGHRFERFQNMTDAHLKNCPKCKKSLRRIIGNGAGFIFKGPGFYSTDYRKPEQKKEDKSPDSVPCKKNSPACQGCPSASKN